jgi:hypothetical protein
VYDNDNRESKEDTNMIEINVTREDIKRSREKIRNKRSVDISVHGVNCIYGNYCPIAIAIRRRFKRSVKVYTVDEIYVNNSNGEYNIVYEVVGKLNINKVAKFMENFDNGDSVRPITFMIDRIQ